MGGWLFTCNIDTILTFFGWGSHSSILTTDDYETNFGADLLKWVSQYASQVIQERQHPATHNVLWWLKEPNMSENPLWFKLQDFNPDNWMNSVQLNSVAFKGSL